MYVFFWNKEGTEDRITKENLNENKIHLGKKQKINRDFIKKIDDEDHLGKMHVGRIKSCRPPRRRQSAKYKVDKRRQSLFPVMEKKEVLQCSTQSSFKATTFQVYRG